MRGLLAGLLIALLVAAVALLVSAVGSLGVAAIGWLLQRWFDLSQWQGSLIALIVTFGLGYLVYKLGAQPPAPATWEPEWDDWDLDEEDEEEAEPPIVPWRRNRPTPGELPAQKPAPTPSTRGKRK